MNNSPNILACLVVTLLATATWQINAVDFVDSGTFQHHPDIEIRLLASEPDVVDPVALTFGDDGKMYVVEMRDYPYGKGSTGTPGGTVRLLEFDAEGGLERSSLFANKLSFPTSIAPWKGGVFVAAPPDIVYLKDTDGDRQADVREVYLTGFTRDVTDSNFSGLRWGLDNRLHGVNGGNNGQIRIPKNPEVSLPLRRGDFSVDPQELTIERTYHTSGGFGLVFDLWGHSFSTHNINHIQQRIIPLRYLERFPSSPVIRATRSISDHEDMARIYPVSVAETRVNHPEQAGHFSSAGGVGGIQSGAFADELEGSLLVCDVVGNLVHRDLLKAAGPIFTASRSPHEQDRDFIASRDNWFRPVGIETGPDGALYLIDMQRAVIEHPDYIPDKLKRNMDIRAGEDRGRIYRVTPKFGLPAMPTPLHRATADQLVRALAHDNTWRRSTAQRLLVERRETGAVPALESLLAADSPQARLHALWTLDGLEALSVEHLQRALGDENENIRSTAIVLLEKRSDWQPAHSAWTALTSDSSPKVRFQTALTLGNYGFEKRSEILAAILNRDVEYQWTVHAVLSSVGDDGVKVLRELLDDARFTALEHEAGVNAVKALCDSIGAGAGIEGQDNIPVALSLLNAQLSPRWKIAALEGLENGVRRSSNRAPNLQGLGTALEAIGKEGPLELQTAIWSFSKAVGLSELPGLKDALTQALEDVSDRERSSEQRQAQMNLLKLGDFETVGGALLALLNGKEPTKVQAAALDVLRQYSNIDVAQSIVENWLELSPKLRPNAINILLGRRNFHPVLIEAVEMEDLTLGELNLDLEQRRLLRRHSSQEVMDRARKLFGDEEYSNRKALVDEWLNRLPKDGNPMEGKKVFEVQCAQCHRLGDIGYDVGPSLAGAAHRSIEDLVSNILDPNMAINPNYTAYQVETSDGEFLSGIVESETDQAFTFVMAQGERRTIARADIDYSSAAGISLMPEGLEVGLNPQQLRDLISFLQQ